MEARNRLIADWFVRLRTGQIKLPRFQRFEAWGHEEISDLIENIFKGLPCGAVLVLEIGDSEPFIARNISGTPSSEERTTEHLVDGQQRLTAFWKAFHDLYPDRTYYVQFEKDAETSKETLKVYGQARWLKEGRKHPLWADKPSEVLGKGFIPLRLLRPVDLGSEITNWCREAVGNEMERIIELKDKITSLRETVIKFNIPFLSLPTNTPKEVALDVFIKMNTNTVPLTTFDIIVAQVEESGKSLHDLIKSLDSNVPSAKYYQKLENWVLSVAALREDKPFTQASFNSLDLRKFITEWNQIEKGLKFTVNFLEEECLYGENCLPTNIVLPFLAALYEFIPESLDQLGSAKILLRKYIWRAFLTRRYENSSATRALQDFKELKLILKGEQGNPPIFNDSEYPIATKDEILGAGWPKRKDILSRAILCISLRKRALDIADSSPVGREHLKLREYHHLFPDSLLSDALFEQKDIYKALNCTLLTWNTNRNISAKEPLKYLRERVERNPLGDDEIKNRLNSHLIPFTELNVGGYSQISNSEDKKQKIRTDYYNFLNKRAEILNEPIEALCKGIDLNGIAYLLRSC